MLLRYTSNGDHPQWIAEAIKSGDTHAVAKLADLAQQLDARQPGRGQSYVDDVMRQLELQDTTNLPLLPPDPRISTPYKSSPVWDEPEPKVEHYADNALTFSAANDTNTEKKAEKYIWRTVGDSKVRSAHADRNGKTFSWDDPPEGGHPGEAPNCRCRAEDVRNSKECEELKNAIENAKFAIKDIRKFVEQDRKNLHEGQRAYVRLEKEFLVLLTTLGLSDIFNGRDDFLTRLEKILGPIGLMGQFHEIELAFHAMKDAEGDINGYKKTLKDHQQVLIDSNGKLLDLARKHDEKCRG